MESPNPTHQKSNSDFDLATSEGQLKSELEKKINSYNLMSITLTIREKTIKELEKRIK